MATRPLSVDIFQAPRYLGTMPTTTHSDVRTIVLAIMREVSGRGRQITLSDERVANVDAALRHGGQFSGGIEALRRAIEGWKRDLRGEADAVGINSYYDAWRTEGYTRRLSGAQEALALRCAELTGVLPPPGSRTPLVVDLGCGSGLSFQPLEERGCAVLGIDLSFVKRK